MDRGHALIYEETLRVPTDAFSYDGFQDWLVSGEFPESGRIDFLAGDVEVDMTAEELHTHGTVKGAILAVLHYLIADTDLGEVFVDSARVQSRLAQLSVEPDVVVVLWESLDAGRVRYVSMSTKREDRFSVMEGAPDLVVEVVSDSSVGKDTRRLPALYARAGVPEFWLVDVRGEEPRFEIRTLREDEYAAVDADAEGWFRSPRLGLAFRLARRRTQRGHWRYVLEHTAST
ncbi:MAG: Uma2 family endonuclease [Thermoanaerobaculia bacterium]